MSVGPFMCVTLLHSVSLPLCLDRKGWPRLWCGSSQRLPSRPTGVPSQTPSEALGPPFPCSERARQGSTLDEQLEPAIQLQAVWGHC